MKQLLKPKDLELTSREKDLIKTAIYTTEEKDKNYYNALKDEFDFIVRKLKSRFTDTGCILEEDFIMDDDGNKADAEYFLQRKKGYEPFYRSACYHWAVFNVEKLTIISYTEGDVYKVVAPDLETFKKEMSESVKYYIENGYSDLDNSNGFFDIEPKKWVLK